MNYNIEEEVWKEIEGYEGLYQISTLGRVRSMKRSIFMKPKDTKDYLMVGLTKNKKQKWFSVHRLVASAFIENPEHKKEVNHIDENTFNNKVQNLQWVTAKENANWGTRTTRMKETLIRNRVAGKNKVIQICAKTNEVVNEFIFIREASRYTGISHSSICDCLNGKLKTASGYKWEYSKR